MNVRENLTSAVSIDFIQSALRSKTFKLICAAGIVSSAYDSYVGIKNLEDHEYMDTASSVIHVATELSVTAGLMGLRKLASDVAITIDDPNVVFETILPHQDPTNSVVS